jgi:hypothetical protein
MLFVRFEKYSLACVDIRCEDLNDGMLAVIMGYGVPLASRLAL